MSCCYEPDYYDRYYDRDDDAPPYSVTCKRCGKTGLSWYHTGERWRLYDDNMRLHTCNSLELAQKEFA